MEAVFDRFVSGNQELEEISALLPTRIDKLKRAQLTLKA